MATIKKIILLALTILMMGCYNQNDVAKSVEEGDFGVCVFDSCEYLVRISVGKGYLAHKGNCRFCKERRKKDLEELVIKSKTTLEITYKDGVATDTVMIFKDKEK